MHEIKKMTPEFKSQQVVNIYHNILWSTYKANVFKILSSQNLDNLKYNIIHFSEYENNRKGLGNLDLSIHDYSYHLMFNGAHEDIPKIKLIMKTIIHMIESKPDIILIPGWSNIEYWVIAIAAKLSGKKIGIFCDSTINDKPKSRFKWIIKRIFVSFGSAFFAYGIRAKEYLISLGANSSNITTRCQTTGRKYSICIESTLKKRIDNFNYKNKPIEFTYIGRLSVEKNLSTLLDAFKLFVDIHPFSKLNIIGTGPQDLYLKELAIKLGISNSLVFYGGQNKNVINEVLLRSTASILPSLSEPWGLVVNESLEMGCPVIVSERCGCVPELANNSMCSIIFNPYDSKNLAESMIAAIDKFKDLEATTIECIKTINPFTSITCASQIHAGVIMNLA